MEFNVPILRSVRKAVASTNGGLKNPPALVFNPTWGSDESNRERTTFDFPPPSGIQRPKNDEDIAYMTVCFWSNVILFFA